MFIVEIQTIALNNLQKHFQYIKGIIMSNSTLVQRQRQPVSTETHSTKQVARHFLAWRKAQKAKLDAKLGHNGGPPIND